MERKPRRKLTGFARGAAASSKRSRNRADRIWFMLMELGGGLGCHQMPERSFSFKGYQFPVCARCTGVLLSFLLSAVVFAKKQVAKPICAALSGVMLLDWGLQRLEILPSTNKRRFITGLIGGFGYCTLHLYLYRYLFGAMKRLFSKLCANRG